MGELVAQMPNDRDFLWCIRAGNFGQAHDLFMEQDCIALGWEYLGDLTAVPNDQQEFAALLRPHNPGAPPGRIAIWAGQLRRFRHEMETGQWVVYRARGEQLVYLAKMTGPYEFLTEDYPQFPHRRKVDWRESFPVTSLTEAARSEMGAAMSLFKIQNHAHEFYRILEGGREPVPPPDGDGPKVTASFVQSMTRDFIIERLAEELPGYALQEFVKNLLEAMDYRAEVTGRGPDQGVDVIAYRDALGVAQPVVKVQVKSTQANIGAPDVSAFFGRVQSGEHGLFVTLGGFTKEADLFARNQRTLRLIDGATLVELIQEHYDSLNPRYKSILPLKRVYAPEPLEEGEG